LHSRSAAESRGIAAALGEAIETAGPAEAIVVALIGPLGAGKTEWAKGLADGLGVDPRLVASPTFVIASEYPGRRPMAHVDLYRLESEAALEATGFRDLLTPGAVVAVEWADRFPSLLPADRIEIEIGRGATGAAEEREITVRATGPTAGKVIGIWTRILEARTRPVYPAYAARE
jgi:tRNA threonylcarbamoyladenosine biosynthesis protein TsaE